MNIRQEKDSEYRRVEALTKQAFWDVYRPGCDEHVLLHHLRTHPSYLPQFSRVLEHDGEIIGHIAYALGSVETAQGERIDLPTFGPVSIRPDMQKYGHGSLLIRHTMELVEQAGYPGVIIFGNDKYYHRFGFESASTHGITYEGMPQEEAPWFMLAIFDEKRMQSIQGIYRNPDCYEVSEQMLKDYESR